MPQFMPIQNDRFDYTRPVNGGDPATDWHGLHSLTDLPTRFPAIPVGRCAKCILNR